MPLKNITKKRIWALLLFWLLTYTYLPTGVPENKLAGPLGVDGAAGGGHPGRRAGRLWTGVCFSLASRSSGHRFFGEHKTHPHLAILSPILNFSPLTSPLRL
jgi:hypothetical protein